MLVETESAMFWFVILVVVLLVIGASVLVGKSLDRRSNPPEGRRRMTRQEQVNAAKASGAFPNRKES
jgi:hypothetical protein